MVHAYGHTGQRMPFGKHRGRLVSDLDTGYLVWLTTIDLKTWLRHAVEAELSSRDDAEHVEEPPPRYAPPAKLPSLISQWYREMSLQLVCPGRSVAGRGFETDLSLTERTIL